MEKNLAIYKEMCIAAERVFNEGIQAPVGSYSLKDLANLGKKNAPKDVNFRRDYNANNIIKICVDTFECSFHAERVFCLAYRFENLAKVNKKDCAMFTRQADNADPVAVFTFDATTYDSLAACHSEKNLRPEMACVFIDFMSGLAVCCDGYIMNVTRLQNARIINPEAFTGGGVLIPREFAKTIKGCEVSIYKQDSDIIAVASNGSSCTLIQGFYPKYKTVLENNEKLSTAPVKLAKNVRELKKAVAAIAKTAVCDVVYMSGLNGDEYITISAMGDGGEITRRVALSSCLTFNFATAVKPEDIKSVNNAADTLYISFHRTILFAGAKVVGLIQPAYSSDKATPTAAAAENVATKLRDVYNVYSNFIAPVAPADSIQEAESIDNADTPNIAPVAPADSIQEAEGIDNTDTPNIAPVAPADSIQEAEGIDNTDTPNIAPVAPADSIQEAEGIDNADTLNIAPVAPADSIQEAEGIDKADTSNLRRMMFVCLRVAAVILFALFVRIVSTNSSNADTSNIAPVAPADSIQTAEGIDNADTSNIAPVTPADNIQAAENIDNADTTNIAPVAPDDSIQEAEGIDNTDTPNIAPVAPADSIQEAEGIDSADTLDIAPVAPADSIQEAESIDNADTIDIAPVAPADSIQEAESIDNADTLDIAPVAPADSIQEAEGIDNADTLNIAPVAPADSLQAAEGIDNADTPNIAPVAHADSIQEAEGIDNADTTNIAPVAPADSIQAAESIDNADTLNIAPVSPADSIQTAEGNDNADTPNIAPVAHSYDLYIIGLSKNGGIPYLLTL